MPFKKGDPNINRKGRAKKGKTLTDLIRKEMNKYTIVKDDATQSEMKVKNKKLFCQTLVGLAVKGNKDAMKLVINYIDGMPATPTDIIDDRQIQDLTKEDIDELYKNLPEKKE